MQVVNLAVYANEALEQQCINNSYTQISIGV